MAVPFDDQVVNLADLSRGQERWQHFILCTFDVHLDYNVWFRLLGNFFKDLCKVERSDGHFLAESCLMFLHLALCIFLHHIHNFVSIDRRPVPCFRSFIKMEADGSVLTGHRSFSQHAHRVPRLLVLFFHAPQPIGKVGVSLKGQHTELLALLWSHIGVGGRRFPGSFLGFDMPRSPLEVTIAIPSLDGVAKISPKVKDDLFTTPVQPINAAVHILIKGNLPITGWVGLPAHEELDE
mmetsp:Transcript_7101/g.8195  ORF Transcript_7101/g.8195 Transcript_7101/m.8195 type:complete len:237 (-) Transcript_7101:568-1278(-)